MIRIWYRVSENPSKFVSGWKSAFKNADVPARKTVSDLVAKFEETGSVADRMESVVGPRVTARTPEAVDAAREVVEEDQQLVSTRRLSQAIGVSQATAHRIMNEDLNLFPYKLQTVQPLPNDAPARRSDFANLILEAVDENRLNLSNVWFTDEAHFWLGGYVNRQNYRIWGTERPTVAVVKPLHPEKLTVWCAVSSDCVLGPYFFDSTVNTDRYIEMLKSKFLPEAYGEGMIADFWFQQDGAPPHRTHAVFDFLHQHFGSRVIAQGFPNRIQGGIDWPPYSPDLNPLDFFLWGYLKDRIYRDRPKSLDELRKAIENEIRAISGDMLQRVIEGFEHRLRHVITAGGYHFENLIN